MAITYNAGTSRIVVTGYTEAVPCTFLDIYNADKAATASLHARAGIVGVDGAAVAVDTALRPTDYVILGGASGDLYITIANWNLMTNATIRVTGTDRDGGAQTDDVVVNANGNFNTAKWFRTVTHTQVTVFNTPGGGSFDYDLTQGQWGFVWKTCDYQFRLDRALQVGASGQTSWFADTNKQVVFSNEASASSRILYVYSNVDSHIRFGVLEDAAVKSTSRGCSIFSLVESLHAFLVAYTGEMNFYASHLACPTSERTDSTLVDSSFYHCILTDNITFYNCVDLDIYHDYFSHAVWGVNRSTGTFDVMVVDKCTHGLAGYQVGGGVFTNCVIRDSDTADIRPLAITVDMTFIDVDCAWTFNWLGVCTADCIRQHTFNLRVVDASGTGIPNVAVSMVDRLGAAVFGVNTDANGDIVEQTITYGYYDQAHGNVIEPGGAGYSPHTVTMSKPGYAPRTIVYTLDRPYVEVEKLGGAAPHGMEYRRRRVPGEVSALVEHE